MQRNKCIFSVTMTFKQKLKELMPSITEKEMKKAETWEVKVKP